MKKILPVTLFAAFALLLAGGSDPAHVQRGDGGGFHGGGGFHDGGFRAGVGFRGASAFRGVFVGGFRGDGFRSGWGWGWGLYRHGYAYSYYPCGYWYDPARPPYHPYYGPYQPPSDDPPVDSYRDNGNSDASWSWVTPKPDDPNRPRDGIEHLRRLFFLI